MANKVRKISLNSKDIKDTIKSLKKMKQEISSLPENIEEILDEAVTYCQKLTPISARDKEHLVHNTYWEKTPTGYRIVQEGENVLFVEFGTGVGNGEHPLANEFNWKYGVGKHIFTTKNGKTGWFFPINESKTEYRFTTGLKPSRQMYETSLWLQKRLDTEIKMKMKKVKNEW